MILKNEKSFFPPTSRSQHSMGWVGKGGEADGGLGEHLS